MPTHEQVSERNQYHHKIEKMKLRTIMKEREMEERETLSNLQSHELNKTGNTLVKTH